MNEYRLYSIHLETAVGPRAELHEASLRVEREVAHVDFAVGLEYSWRIPVIHHKHVI